MPTKYAGAKKDVSQEEFEKNMKRSLDDMKENNYVSMPKDVDRDDYFDAVKKTAKEIETKLKDEGAYPYKRVNPEMNDGNVEGKKMKVNIYTNKEGEKNASLSFNNGSNENIVQLKILLDKEAKVNGVLASTDVETRKGAKGTFYVGTDFRRYEDVDNLPKSLSRICEVVGFNNPEREYVELTPAEKTMRLVAKKMGEVNKGLAENSTQRMYIGDPVKDDNGDFVLDATKKDKDGNPARVYGQIFESKNKDGELTGHYFTIHNRQQEQVRVYLDLEGNLNHINYADWNGYNKETKEFDKGYSAYEYNLTPRDDRATFEKFTEIMDKVVAELGDKYVVPTKEAKESPEADGVASYDDVDIADIEIPDMEQAIIE